MADRYWVGGSGSWNSTTKWSATSGGASGASVPTSADNAIFDAASGGAHYTVTVTDSSTCADLTFTPVAFNGVTQFVVGSGFVIAGTFSTSGTSGNRRAWFRSSTYGLTRDMQIATIGTVTDVDFRDTRITGAGGTLSGTRIGDLRGNFGITFSTPKTVYWVTAAGGSWSASNWAASSGGAASTTNFPLAQDTVVIENTGLNTSATVTMDNALPYFGSLDMSTRTNAMTLSTSAYSIYGNFTLGSGCTISGGGNLTFSGRGTQTITSAGKTYGNGITVDTYGGTLELADALNIGGSVITLNNGTFDTKSYSVTAGDLASANTNVRGVKLGSSTVTLAAAPSFTSPTNLTFDAGTSSIVVTAANPAFTGGGLSFYGVSFNSTSAGSITIAGVNSFNSLSITAPSSGGLRQVVFSGNQTITGTLTSSGATSVRRISLQSSSLGTTRTLTVGTLSADDCDFRDITIAGTAAGTSPTRAGDCGGNSGVTFPAPKTVYWNLAGTQNWSATAWATTSGGTPALNNFPLSQDTAVFDNTGSAGTVTLQTFHIGAVNMSARTSAMTLTTSTNLPLVYGNWLFGTGVTSSATAGTITFSGRGTSTITCNGVTFNCPVTVDCASGIVQLADAFLLGSTLTLTHITGTFDVVSYNVTAGLFVVSGGNKILKMGSGTWTLASTGTVWSMSSTGLVLYKGTADILLSNTSTTARTFTGGGQSYNKLTIGGTTGSSSLTITGSNTFTELASTKTVAHTIALGTTVQTFGKWTVTGTVGNVVTLTGTGVSHILSGSCTSGIDYLAMGSIGFAATSPGEFYAGVNSTGTAAAPVYRTAKPADSTRYWVGGTGNWSDTARWSTSSGGASGASVPRSHDNVVFDSASNAIAYTATVNTVTGGARCKALTIAGPLVGNVTLAGTVALFIHDNITLPATGLTRTYTGAITLSGSTAGKTVTSNGVALISSVTIDGVGAEWSLASALDLQDSGVLAFSRGSFSTNNYSVSCQNISSTTLDTRVINLGSSTINCSGGFTLGSGDDTRANLTFSSGTSQINFTLTSLVVTGSQTFYNVSFTSTSITSVSLTGQNTFNNLSFAGRTGAGVANVILSTNQTINGTLTLSGGTSANMRTFVRSSTIGATRTLTCAAFSGTDADFRDITIAGAAAPASGTRLGDCKGNSGITFASGVNKYWNLAGGGNWSATGWATTSGGTPADNNFPLAQDTCIFEATGLNSGATITVDVAYNIGTVNMSARTGNTMTLANGSTTPTFYGNWINGSGTTITGTGTLTFAGRGAQTITSAGVSFTQGITINTPTGAVTLQDALTANTASNLTLTAGTLDANSYNLTLSNAVGGFNSTGTEVRTLAVGSGTWTIASTTSAFNATISTNLTVTGTGTVSLTSASTKNFAGGGASYSGVTLNQGGSGTLSLLDSNTFGNISNSYSATGATTILFSTTTQRVNNFTATGESGRVLTIQGTSSTSPCTLIHIGTGDIDVNYVTITGVRAYPT